MGLSKKQAGIALLAGLGSVLGFAPFGIFPLPMLALCLLFWLWQQAVTPRQAAALGFCFGIGLFSSGISGLYVAMHDYGDMPALLALPATLLFAAFLALFPALAGYLQQRGRVQPVLQVVLVMPGIWVLSEWLRGLLLTGFPWLVLGYAHSDSPLAGYAPVLGVYGVSLANALSAGLLALAWHARAGRVGALAATALLLLWGAGAGLRTVAWTQPQGEPFSVALVQGNIPQQLKFETEALVGTLETYRRLVLENQARLTVLPETAFPLMRQEVPAALLEQLRDHARGNGGDVVVGVFERDHGGYYNSVFTTGSAGEQHYRKQHLVPFGEFVPLRPVLGWLINEVLDIPMGDLVRGEVRQAPLEIAGQRVAVNICYEDVFGEEIIRALPDATVLVNVTNDAWYGGSPMAAQHNQISQLRALETGRMMLRATNTGVTSLIGTDGKVLQQLPQHQEGVLLGSASGYRGVTPYVRWGNAAVLTVVALLLAAAWITRWTGRKR